MDRTYKTFTESFTNVLKSPIKSLKSIGYQHDTFWALKDINFEVEQGEVVGIIGRNGAGKSTLLKILSRITTPTEGEIHLKGRVGSLLEVGTGFHPELTGRENIYFNGAILGMKKKEIDDKFDEIVKFSGVEKFLDTPAKRYSSGMQVRLAFSVAANLDPEILVVDEVLAVGDAKFQKKCLRKMGSVSNEGRTVLLVSHNMAAIQNICQRAIVIKEGKIVVDSTSDEAISFYLNDGVNRNSNSIYYPKSFCPGDDYVRLNSVRIFTEKDPNPVSISIGVSMYIEIIFTIKKNINNFHNYIRLTTESGILVFGSGDWDCTDKFETSYSPGQYLAICKIPGNLLNAGTYSISIWGQIPHVKYIFQEDNVIELIISELDGSGGVYSVSRPGIIRPRLNWRTEKI